MLGDEIKKQRATRRMTQEQLAKAAGVSRGLIAKYEAGFYKDIPMSTLIKIANALRIQPLRLMMK